MKVSIGKNTLGGGKKMTTSLRNYNRSTHDLSFITRTTMAPGVLVPTLKLKVLPGDTFPIQTRCHTLTHPTIGPLFGSFKQQNDFFFCPDRLYNAMLHNNALNVGLNMSQVKYPIIEFQPTDPAEEPTWDPNGYIEGSNNTIRKQIHPSSLLAYLGYRCAERELSQSRTYEWQCVPILAYFDIFKNYYANKQESKFYVIGGDSTIKNEKNEIKDNSWKLCMFRTQNNGETWEAKSESVDTSLKNQFLIEGSESGRSAFGFIITRDNLATNISEYALQMEGKITIVTPYKEINLNINSTIPELIENGTVENIKLTNLTNPNSVAYIFTETDEIDVITEKLYLERKPRLYKWQGDYKAYDLTLIDEMREAILQTPKQNRFVANQIKFINDIVTNVPDHDIYEMPACANPMVGLCLKTYQSDINVNWVNTEWIEGDNGINAITAVDTSSGSFTIDQLNLAQKVYTMLNRIAVSDGSYNAWIQTVYSSKGLNHIETPIYLGGSSLEIEFQEVINNSGTENQPLGSLAGRGVATNHKGGDVIFKADEPGYIICITSITPRVDYFQGNDWDCYLENMDELHKPQLDGIGFQDRLYRHLNASAATADLNKSIGKQPAWIEYMTNVNKTFGNFAIIENEGWMCLNRIFNDIDSYTTYIFPHLYNNIFADTELTAQNFWVQIGFNTKPRRVMSAKQIPNI